MRDYVCVHTAANTLVSVVDGGVAAELQRVEVERVRRDLRVGDVHVQLRQQRVREARSLQDLTFQTVVLLFNKDEPMIRAEKRKNRHE